MTTLTNTIWPKKYESQCIDDLILPARMIEFFKKAVDEPMQFPNLMLYSPAAGVMKTTTARVIASEMANRYDSDFKIINSSKDGNKETIQTEIIDWGSFNGFAKGPKIVILDETDKSNPKTFLEPLLGTIEMLYESTRFILTANGLSNFAPYANSRIEVIDFTFTETSEIREMMLKLFNRLVFVCETEKIEYDPKSIQALIKTYFPDVRMVISRLYSCYLRYGKIIGDNFKNTQPFDRYVRIQDLVIGGDFTGARTLYNQMPPETDIFTAFMSQEFIERVSDATKQMKIACAVRNHMIPHNTVIDKEINISSMFAEIIMILKDLK